MTSKLVQLDVTNVQIEYIRDRVEIAKGLAIALQNILEGRSGEGVATSLAKAIHDQTLAAESEVQSILETVAEANE